MNLNPNELAKWWEIQGSHYSMANSQVNPLDQAVLLSLESKYEEDFQRNLREDVCACDNDFLERWTNVKVLKNAFEQNIKMEISYIESSNQIEDNTVDINIGMEDTIPYSDQWIRMQNNMSKSLEKTSIRKTGTSLRPSQRFKKRLTNFYREYCPDKLSNIDSLTNKYFEKEKSLFEKLILKYGEEKNKCYLPKNNTENTVKMYKDRCGSFDIFYDEDTKKLLLEIHKSKGPISQSILDKI